MRTPSIRKRFSTRHDRHLALTLLVAGALLVAAPSGAPAATIAVGTTVDELDGDTDCSLREAIQAANTDAAVSGCAAGSGADTITVPAGFYQLTRVGAGEDGNATGDLDVASDVTIRGTGAVIDGNDTDRVLHVLAGTVLVEGLIIQNGKAPAGAPGAGCTNQVDCSQSAGDGAEGGGILTHPGSNLTLRRVTVADNEAGVGGPAGNISCPAPAAECDTYGGSGGNGGGVSANGSLTIERSLVTGNRSGAGGPAGTEGPCGGFCFSGVGNPGDGGGVIVTGGSMTLLASTVDDNDSPDWAGGVYCHHNSSCTIRDTTIVGNSAASFGGGLTVTGSVTTATVTNTTISGNTAGFSGGGGVAAFTGSLLLDFVTVAGNSASEGGGIKRALNSLTMRNSIVADNTNPGSTSPNCSGIVTSGGYNHVESLTGCTMALATGDVAGSDPGLLALGDNGGPTDTQAPALGSTTRNTIPTGTNGCGTTITDQRSATRPDSTSAACDKGAFERESATDCPAALPVCETATKSKLTLKDVSPDAGKDQLNWKFQGGAGPLTQAQLGDPTTGTVWNLCVYHDATLRASLRTDDPAKWSALKTKGYQYKDKNKVPSGDGLKKVLLKVGDAGKTQAQFIGKGDNLPDPLPLSAVPPNVAVVARNNSTATCFSAAYSTAKKNLTNVLQAP